MPPEVLVRVSYKDDASSSGVSEESVSLIGLPPPITLRKVRAAFPFEGTFHFRAKASLKASSADFMWMDIGVDDEVILPAGDGSCTIELKALMLDGPLDPPLAGQQDFLEYSEKVLKVTKQRIAGVRKGHNGDDIDDDDDDDDDISRRDESILKKLGVPRVLQKTAVKAVDMGMKSVAVGATSIWNNLKTIGASIQSGINTITTLPNTAMSDQTEEVLAALGEDVSVTFKSANKEHVDLLRKLWKALFVDCKESFSLTAAQWREAGFQKDGPAADLKSSGVLAIKSVVHMAAVYPAQTQEMLARNKSNVKSNYPFAAVAVNVTLLLAEVFHLRGSKYLSTSASYWGMFESEASFYEVFSAVFFKLDKMWAENGVQRAGFGELIGQVRGAVLRALAQGPANVLEFRTFIEEA